jgi:2-keto-3-deoxy-L-rhamnonate aldolase RhmA
MLVVQVETRSAVKELDAILATPGLDMALGGRGTLASECGVPGQRDHPRIEEIEATIIEKARGASKIVSVTYLPLRDPARPAWCTTGSPGALTASAWGSTPTWYTRTAGCLKTWRGHPLSLASRNTMP